MKKFCVWSRSRSRLFLPGAAAGARADPSRSEPWVLESGTLATWSRSQSQSRPKKWRLHNTAISTLTYYLAQTVVLSIWSLGSMITAIGIATACFEMLYVTKFSSLFAWCPEKVGRLTFTVITMCCLVPNLLITIDNTWKGERTCSSSYSIIHWTGLSEQWAIWPWASNCSFSSDLCCYASHLLSYYTMLFESVQNSF